jgi:hypothetical protein
MDNTSMSDTDKSELDLPRLHHIIMHQLREARSHGNNSTITELAKPIKKELDRYITQQCNQARIEAVNNLWLYRNDGLTLNDNYSEEFKNAALANRVDAYLDELRELQAQAKETEG